MLRASNPADLLALMPYLLGYHPTESLLVVSIDGGRVGTCARLDLPRNAAEQAALSLGAEFAVSSQSMSAVLLLAISSVVDRARDALAEVQQSLSKTTSAYVVEAVYADADRWWSLTCTSGCCPAEGTPYRSDTNALAAEAVLAGLGAAPDRQTLAAGFAGPPVEENVHLRACRRAVRDDWPADWVTPRVGSLAARRRAIQDAVDQGLSGEGQPTPRQCVELAELALDLGVRDVAWAMITPETAQRHLDLWRRVVRHAVPELACAPLCLAGVAAWIAGDGTTQVCCAERALAVDPSYTMATLLLDLNRSGAPPQLWQQIAGGLRTELGLPSELGEAIATKR